MFGDALADDTPGDPFGAEEVDLRVGDPREVLSPGGF